MKRCSSNLFGRFSAIALIPFALSFGGCSGQSGSDFGDPDIAQTQQELIDFTICPAGSTIVQGTAGNDVLNFSGATGPMCILGNGGNDTITGGPFADMLVGGNGNDIMNGGPGADIFHGENGDDTIHGDDGDDQVYGEGNNDTIFGDNGADYLVGAGQDDTIHGGADDDIIYGQGENDTLHGDDGNDKIFGGLGIDTLEGGNGDDRLQADDGDDHLWGDFINNATATTGSTVDSLYAGSGNDDLHGGPGNDLLFGESGTDSLEGDDGDDRLSGGTGGTKTLSGGNGNDLAKGTGTGTASGDANNDVLVVAGTSNGGDGTDACAGTACELAEPPSFCTQVAGQCGTGQRCATEVGVCIYCQHDSECSSGQCVPTVGCTSKEVVCNDGLDDDGDSAIDCADSDCAQDVSCQTGVTQLGNSGVWHDCITNSSGEVKCWGRNHCGQLGYFTADHATQQKSTNATLISTPLAGTPKMVRGGNAHTCVLLTNGTVQCWGRNVEGQLGVGAFGTNTNPAFPQCTGTAQTVKDAAGTGTLSGVVLLASGGHSNCAVLSNGTVQCWGQNIWGQLGNGASPLGNSQSANNRNLPVAVQGLSGNVIEVKIGSQAACARLTSGAVQCWGRNHYGQLGNNSINPSSTAVSVGGLGSVAEIGVGGEFACARRTNGSVACWGANYAGQLGLGTNDNNMPHNATTVPAATGATNISLGWYHACIVRGTGQTMCWGMNDFGQLGFGSTSSFRATPANLLGINDGTNFGMGEKHTCLRRKSGSLTCWGSNEFGQIGNGTFSATTPVLSPFTVTNVP
jgi:alpha-tubulin suppressor-like RCC1 family protein